MAGSSPLARIFWGFQAYLTNDRIQRRGRRALICLAPLQSWNISLAFFWLCVFIKAAKKNGPRHLPVELTAYEEGEKVAFLSWDAIAAHFRNNDNPFKESILIKAEPAKWFAVLLR